MPSLAPLSSFSVIFSLVGKDSTWDWVVDDAEPTYQNTGELCRTLVASIELSCNYRRSNNRIRGHTIFEVINPGIVAGMGTGA